MLLKPGVEIRAPVAHHAVREFDVLWPAARDSPVVEGPLGAVDIARSCFRPHDFTRVVSVVHTLGGKVTHGHALFRSYAYANNCNNNELRK